MKRGGWGGELYEKAEMQRKVKELFVGLKNGKDNGWRQGDNAGLVVVDAGKTVEGVAEVIWDAIKDQLANIPNDINTLA